MNRGRGGSGFSDTDYYKQFQQIDDDIAGAEIVPPPVSSRPVAAQQPPTRHPSADDAHLSVDEIERLVDERVRQAPLEDNSGDLPGLADLRYESSVDPPLTQRDRSAEAASYGDDIVYRSAQRSPGKSRRVLSFRRSYRRKRRWRRRLYFGTWCVLSLGLLVLLAWDLILPYSTGLAVFQSAQERHQSRRYAEAAALYERFRTSYPEHPLSADALFYGATCLEQAGRRSEAEEAYGRYLRDNAHGRHVALACFRLGQLKAAQDQDEEAVQYYQRAAQAAPSGPFASQVQVALGRVYLDRGETEPARHAFERAVSLSRTNPGAVTALYELGRLAAARNDLDTARRCYEQAARLLPGDPAARKARAELDRLFPGAASDGRQHGVIAEATSE